MADKSSTPNGKENVDIRASFGAHAYPSLEKEPAEELETEPSEAPQLAEHLLAATDAAPATGASPEPAVTAADLAASLHEGLAAAEERAQSLATQVAVVQAELRLVASALADASRRAERRREIGLPKAMVVVRVGVLALLVGLLGLTIWARAVDYALRVTSDTPTFIALVSDMAQRPFASQSPFLAAGVATQHATPYLQALAFLWRLVGGHSPDPIAVGRFLALVGIAVFAFTLWCVFLYVRRVAGSLAAWLSMPVVLGIFGPPHVIWASDLSLHSALYAGFFPQNVAIGAALLTLLMLDRRTAGALVLACLLAALTMVVHPFTGVLLCVLASTEACRLALRRERAAARAPLSLVVGFVLGMAWPAYSLDQAFTESGMRGVVLIALCVAAPLVCWGISARDPGRLLQPLSRVGSWLRGERSALLLAILGAAGTAVIALWELVLVHSPPKESARLAIYWVDGRWRWPLLLVAGTVGLCGLARLARRGYVVPAVWFAGCFGLGLLGALGLPLPVWYRFLLLCQIPLAIGVATVLADALLSWTSAIVAATFALTLSVKVLTLVAAPPTVSYFGQTLQPAWSLGAHVPPGKGLVATDPATAYFVPATTGRRVLTVDKGHVSSAHELALAQDGYALLRRYYAGGPTWWQAGQAMWRRDVRYVVVQKQTTLEPKSLTDFIWQTARLRTPAQLQALGNYFYENNRIGTLVYSSGDFAVYRLERRKLFPPDGPSKRRGAS